MSVRLELTCNGCAVGPVTGGYLRREFRSLDGQRAYGFGRWLLAVDERHAAEDWLLFDPYTSCTYCPVCAEELFGPPVNQDAAAEMPASFDHYAALSVS